MQGGESDSGGRGAGLLEIAHDDAPSPPLSLSFGKVYKSLNYFLLLSRLVEDPKAFQNVILWA